MLAVGSVIRLTCLETNQSVQYNHKTKELDAKGGPKFFWEAVESLSKHNEDQCVLQLRSFHSRRYICLTESFEVETTSEPDVTCDIHIHFLSGGGIALEFVASPGCFIGFSEFGIPKTATEASVLDTFNFVFRENIKDDEEPRTPKQSPIATNRHPPSFTSIPTNLLSRRDGFHDICVQRAKSFDSYFSELKVSYIGVLSISIVDCSLNVSKEGRSVYAIFSSQLSCFGDNTDSIRINARGKYPDIIFDDTIFYFPVFEVSGKLIGRKITTINILVKRQRPKWKDKKESFGTIHLEPFIPKKIMNASFEEQIIVSNDSTKKGYFVFDMKYTKYDNK